MDLFYIQIILPLKILDITNRVLYRFLLSTIHALKTSWDVIAVFKQL